MSAAMRSPPAAARVTLELLEQLRALSVNERRIVAVRAAVDRLRVLAVQLLALEKEDGAGSGGLTATTTGELAIAALVADAIERLEHSAGDESEEALMAAFALALDLHRRIDVLESELIGANQGDTSRPEWLHDWQRDCCGLLPAGMRRRSNSDTSSGPSKVEETHGLADDESTRVALVEVIELAVRSLPPSSNTTALRTRLAALARSVPLPTLRARRRQRGHWHVLAAAARSNRVGVIPPHELIDELDDSAPAASQGGLRRGEWLGTRVAVFSAAAPADGGFHARVRDLFLLNHPNVLQLYGGCERVTAAGETTRVLVCEPVDGSLAQLLAAPTRQLRLEEDDGAAETPRFVWRALLQAALALKFLHQRGVARGDVTCSQILMGVDGAARLPAFRDLPAASSPRYRWWRSPERLAGPKETSATIASDIFSLGMCVVEAAVRWQHRLTLQTEPESEEAGLQVAVSEISLPERGSEGRGLPSRPRQGFSDAQWAVVSAMCHPEPSQRMEMASVVHEIKRFLQQLERPEPLSAAQTPYRTAESLGELELMVERMSAHDEDGRAMTTHVLHRLLDVHAQLEAWAVTQQQQPRRRPSLFRVCGLSSGALTSDATLERAETSAQADDELKQAIASFRETLERFYAHVDTALQAVSAHYDDAMLELMCESRTKGADEHFGFHTEIDRLLHRHLTARHDGVVSAVHDWRPQWERQRSRQVERAKRRLQTMLLSSQHRGAGGHGAITSSCHGCDEDHVTPSTSEEGNSTGVGTRQALAAISSVLGMPDWFTPPQEVMFDSRQSFSEGAFGSVHHGWWLDARVVIKKIKATTAITLDCSQGESQDATFRREVGIWHSLRHPHVVSLFGACYTSHERFFVCEDAAQGQLSDYLKDVAARKGGSARVVAAWEKLLEAARGLQYLHARGVLHQDLKCDNILVGSDGRAKLTDFGLSASVLRGHQRHLSQLVKTVGAPRWKAPEVLRHEPPTMESDVFSLAMCVVEAVTGAFPWGNSQPDAAVAFHVKRGRPLEVGKQCFSAGEWAVVQEMSRSDPARRLPLEGVVQALDAVARKHRAAVSWA